MSQKAVVVQVLLGTGEKSIKLISLRLDPLTEDLGELSLVTLLLLVEFGLPVAPALKLAMPPGEDGQQSDLKA